MKKMPPETEVITLRRELADALEAMERMNSELAGLRALIPDDDELTGLTLTECVKAMALRLKSTYSWVKVCERMPDADLTVLGALEDNAEPVWLVYYDGEEWREVDGLPVAVVAWTPLPEPQ